MGYHSKSGKRSAKNRSSKNKKGGSIGSLISQLAAPVVLFSANHIYGKKTRRRTKKTGRRYRKKSMKRSRKTSSRRRK